MAVNLVTCLPLSRDGLERVRRWCGQNLVGTWQITRCDQCEVPDASWTVVCDHRDFAIRYRLTVSTPEDHALVRLTWQ